MKFSELFSEIDDQYLWDAIRSRDININEINLYQLNKIGHLILKTREIHITLADGQTIEAFALKEIQTRLNNKYLTKESWKN